MYDESENQLRRELGPEEQLLWSGRPKQGFCLRTADFILIPFSLWWVGMLAHVLSSESIEGDSLLYEPLFFLIVPFGLYLFVGRFLVDAKQRKNTYYGITNERALVISGIFERSVESFDIHTLNNISIIHNYDGYGTVTLRPAPGVYKHMPLGWPTLKIYAPIAFDAIDDAKLAYDTIRKLQRESKKPTQSVS